MIMLQAQHRNREADWMSIIENEGDKLAIDQLGDGTIILKKLVNRLCFRTAE